jgi:hypothetical protein
MQRTLWSGHISFDLLYIPVTLCPAAREKRIQFHYVYGIDGATSTRAASAFAGSAVSNVLRFPSNDPAAAPIPEHVARVRRLYAGMDGVPLESSAILRAIEPKPGRFAVFRDAEFKRLRAPKSSTIEIARHAGARMRRSASLAISSARWRARSERPPSASAWIPGDPPEQELLMVRARFLAEDLPVFLVQLAHGHVPQILNLLANRNLQSVLLSPSR